MPLNTQKAFWDLRLPDGLLLNLLKSLVVFHDVSENNPKTPRSPLVKSHCKAVQNFNGKSTGSKPICRNPKSPQRRKVLLRLPADRPNEPRPETHIFSMLMLQKVLRMLC